MRLVARAAARRGPVFMRRALDRTRARRVGVRETDESIIVPPRRAARIADRPHAVEASSALWVAEGAVLVLVAAARAERHACAAGRRRGNPVARARACAWRRRFAVAPQRPRRRPHRLRADRAAEVLRRAESLRRAALLGKVASGVDRDDQPASALGAQHHVERRLVVARVQRARELAGRGRLGREVDNRS